MSNPAEKTELRKVIDLLHGSKWARIVPLTLMGVIHLVSMIAWRPTEPMAWVLPLILDAFLAGGMYFINRFTPGSELFNNIAVVFFSVCSACVTLMVLRGLPNTLPQGFNPGLGAGPAMFLGISLYHRRRMKKGC